MNPEIYETDADGTGKPVLAPGAQIGALVLLSRAGKDAHGNAMWLCRCTACRKNDKLVRADNLRNGRTKSCGCQQHATTVGRRNQMSDITPPASIPVRFRIYGYMAPPQFTTQGTKSSRCYAVVFVEDPTHKAYWQGDNSRYYLTDINLRRHSGGNGNPIINATMSRLAKLKWLNPRQPGTTYLAWAITEGVAATVKKVPTLHHLEDQYAKMYQATHIDVRGQFIL